MYSLTKKTEDSSNPQKARCSDHGKPLELFCETCDTVICVNCSVRNHKHHEYDLITGSSQQVLRSKKQMMEHSHYPLLSLNVKMSMSEVTAQINVEELQPKEKADFVLSKDIKSLHHIGDIVTYSCRVKKVGCFERLPKEKKVSFSLSMEAPDSSLLSVPFSFLRCSLVPVGKGDQPIHTTVTTTSTDPGVYRIQCNPSTSGTHTVKVQVYDVQLEDTSLVIPINPYLDNITPVRTITELKRPWGVAVSDDNHIIITELGGDCVTILDREGKKVKSLGGKGGSGIMSSFHLLVV